MKVLVAAFAAVCFLVPSQAHAQTVPVSCGCSSDPTTSLGKCLNDFRALPADPLIPNRVIDDIFKTSDGKDARQLNFATYFRGLAAATPGGAAPPLSGCIGVSTNRYNGQSCVGCDCTTCTPVQCTAYSCSETWDHTAATAHDYADKLDWKWWQFDRGTWESNWVTRVADQVRDCPDINNAAQCSYNPVHGMIYDLGGEANRVAVFAITDHTSDSCLEPFEWTVWLTDNPDATATVRDTEAPDPMKWNRAKLDQIFLKGWTRNPNSLGLATDTTDLNSVAAGDALADSPTVVFSLPCGITFRYASIISGNFGSPGPNCEFNSEDDEVDAVAGLNADNTVICPDADQDGFRDAACGGTDCNDHDPAFHPGAVETCSETRDLDCSGGPTTCPSSTRCFQGQCVPVCFEGGCVTGFTCEQNQFCVPNNCVGMTCPGGQLCGPNGCQDPCTGATCPVGQVCRGGACLDPCQGVICPVRQHCQADAMGKGQCVPSCSCLPCTSGICNATSGRCEATGCDTLTCNPGETRDCTGTTPRCLTRCQGVSCPLGQQCDATSGQCKRDMCFGVVCQFGLHCQDGMCIATDGGVGGGDGGGGDGGRDGAVNDGGGADGAGGDGGTREITAEGSGCGCRTGGQASSGGLWLLAGLAGLCLLRARRRR